MLGLLVCIAIFAAGCVAVTETGTSRSGDIQRAYPSPTAFYDKSIIIPPGYQTIRLPGIVPDPATPARDGQPAVYGDTETQTASARAKIAAALAELGASEADVVAMTVYLVDPGQPMDFAGMMRA